MSKAVEVAYALLKDLASNNYQWSSKWTKSKPMAGVLELDNMNNIASQLAALNNRFDRFERENINVVQAKNFCGNCAGEHSIVECLW